jgi:recombinational DNA repair protein (RecF pathway)
VGYGPELARCVRCGKAVRDRAWFGLISGGILCPACCNQELNPMDISAAALELLREYESESIGKLRQTHSAGNASREASDILNAFVRAQISEGAKIRSLDFLERIRDTSYA